MKKYVGLEEAFGNLVLDQAAQGSDGVTISGGISQTCRCDIWEQGLVVALAVPG